EYPGVTLLFSIPAHTFFLTGGIAEVTDTTTVGTDSFSAFQSGPVSFVSGQLLTLGLGVELTSSLTTPFSSTDFPIHLNLADFPFAVMAITQDDFAGRVNVGHSELDFDITNLTEVSSTPLPAALPLFATGLGALGLLGWRRRGLGTSLKSSR